MADVLTLPIPTKGIAFVSKYAWSNRRDSPKNRNPLIDQIIAICKENEIPFVFAFQLTGEEDERGPMFCTSALLPDGCAEKLKEATKILSAPTPTHASTLLLTTRSEGGEVTSQEYIVYLGDYVKEEES